MLKRPGPGLIYVRQVRNHFTLQQILFLILIIILQTIFLNKLFNIPTVYRNELIIYNQLFEMHIHMILKYYNFENEDDLK